MVLNAQKRVMVFYGVFLCGRFVLVSSFITFTDRSGPNGRK